MATSLARHAPAPQSPSRGPARIVDLRGRPLAQYEAASVGRRTAHWTTRPTDVNAEIKASLPKTRERTRALGRDHPWAKRAVQAIVTNVVGDGIRAQWQDPAVQALWNGWFDSATLDADGLMDGYGFSALALRTIIEGGEVLIRKRPRRPEDGMILPLQLHMLEGDQLDLAKSEALPNGQIRYGVEFDPIGRRRAYWLFDAHPGADASAATASRTSSPYPARDFLHVFRVERPGQVRGMPWGTGSVHRLRMLDDYVDAQLERQRKAACFMAWRRAPDHLAEPLEDASPLLDRLEPGIIEDLPPGWDIEFATPPQPEDDERFMRARLREVAADYGIPYEVLTGDLSQVNFSSARMGWNEFARNIETWRWQLLVPRLLNPLVDWFREAAALIGFTVVQPYPLWTAPARVMVDATREVPALIKAIRAGLISTKQAIRQQGYDPDLLLAEELDWRAKTATAGLLFDSDPGADLGRDPDGPDDGPDTDEDSNDNT